MENNCLSPSHKSTRGTIKISTFKSTTEKTRQSLPWQQDHAMCTGELQHSPSGDELVTPRNGINASYHNACHSLRFLWSQIVQQCKQLPICMLKGMLCYSNGL